MDFIEQWFGLSLDSGNGSLEALWLVALSAIAAVIVFRRRIAAWLSSGACEGALPSSDRRMECHTEMSSSRSPSAPTRSQSSMHKSLSRQRSS